MPVLVAVLAAVLCAAPANAAPMTRRTLSQHRLDARHQRRTYLPGAYPKKIRPKVSSLSGDGSDGLRNLRWSRWTIKNAYGRGIEGIDDCNPDCADGSFSNYPVKIHAYTPRYLRCGVFFSKIKFTYTRRVPNGEKRSWIFKVDPSDDALELYTIGPCSS
ncbi:hypothetical protein [uncultured Jatrophihabitans sp.]|uniref:hypothetical protein n=1 Tax=uncultured Jatrophihabitans sp. TaxID=1610747 RepID=UPI0035C951EC